MDCPNCRQALTECALDRQYGGKLTIDLCPGCRIIWFDQLELLQLAPAATLELVARFAEDAGAARQPLQMELRCPRCGQGLEEVSDLQRTTRFSYQMCPNRHGRLLTFYQFLRAKNFVRALSAAEIRELRRHVQQVNCSNCGAPVDVGGDIACKFCRTPVAILDPEQLKKTVGELQKAQEQKPLDPLLPLRLADEKLKIERLFAGFDEGESRGSLLGGSFEDGGDPLATGLRALGKLFEL